VCFTSSAGRHHRRLQAELHAAAGVARGGG